MTTKKNGKQEGVKGNLSRAYDHEFAMNHCQKQKRKITRKLKNVNNKTGPLFAGPFPFLPDCFDPFRVVNKWVSIMLVICKDDFIPVSFKVIDRIKLIPAF